MAGEVALQDSTERLFRGARLGPVVVGEIEVRNAEIECAPGHGARLVRRVDAPEVVPQAERDRRQDEPAAAASAVGHPVVTRGRGGHGWK
jgi:hypothetical protein